MKFLKQLCQSSTSDPIRTKSGHSPIGAMFVLKGFIECCLPVLGFILVGLQPILAIAQTPPIMVIDDASVFEGNSGSAVLKLPVHFVGTQSSTVTGTVTAVPLTGTGFNPATGGSACGGSVDFVQFSSVPFSIPPNTPNGTLSVNIAVCGDTVIEPNEQIFVFFSNVSGADCSLEGTCSAVGTILDDDGPVRISINNVATSEPAFFGLQKTVSFTVSLNHPSTQSTSVHFATSDGTAKCCPTLLSTGDYVSTSGTLIIPAGTLTGLIPVTINGDGIAEPNQTFFVNLTNPINATIFDGTGQGTILDTTLTIGGFDLSPDNARVQNDEVVNYSLTWTVPEGEVWHDLKSLDLRLRQGNQIALWIRWDEASNTFSLCQRIGSRGNGKPGSAVACTPGQPPDSLPLLQGELAQLHLAEATITGSGPTGRSVTLNLPISFTGNAEGHYVVELAATDDFGNQDDFVDASVLLVGPTNPHQ